MKTETVASSCCTLLGESTEKVNAGRGQPDKYEMEKVHHSDKTLKLIQFVGK